MAAKFKAGSTVRQIMTAPIEGKVVGFRMDELTGDRLVHVAWKEKDEDGAEHIHAHFFTEEQLERTDDDSKEAA